MIRFLVAGGIGLATILCLLTAPAFANERTPRRVISAEDACDPTTFNQALGPGTCVGNGRVTVQRFLQQLQRLQREPQWRFTPDRVHARTVDPVVVKNVGGEMHTFTEVAAFGGGVNPQLNQLAGNLTERPECAAGPGDDNHALTPGASFVFTESQPGTHLYQCCIHPWMHSVLSIRAEREPPDDNSD
jgi:plastocyanin